jgi:glycine cleavage system aminomethyltransferase T
VGATVEADGSTVGRVTSSGRSPALGPVALGVLGRAVEIGQRVTLSDGAFSGEATVVTLPMR